jgi:NIMA (never in mitosis gene a)-related kinase 1/4/5
MEQAKTMVGTPYYISPEIVKGKQYSFKTDIWSLGIIIHEICCLEVPINASNLHNLYLKITDPNTVIKPIPS